MPTPNQRYLIPTRRMDFYGLVHQLLPMASGANGSGLGSVDTIQMDGQADLLVYKQAAIYENGDDCVTFVLGSGDLQQDQPFPLAMIGSGQFPSVLASPMTVPRGASFSMNAFDRKVAAGANNMRVLHFGAKLYQQPVFTGREYSLVKPYRFTANFAATDGGPGALVANGLGQISVNAPSDYDLEVRKMKIALDGDVTVQMNLSGDQLQRFNRPCHSALLGATAYGATITTGSWPIIFPVPIFIGATRGLQFTLYDLGVAPDPLANRVRITLECNRLYPPGGFPVAA